ERRGSQVVCAPACGRTVRTIHIDVVGGRSVQQWAPEVGEVEWRVHGWCARRCTEAGGEPPLRYDRKLVTRPHDRGLGRGPALGRDREVLDWSRFIVGGGIGRLAAGAKHQGERRREQRGRTHSPESQTLPRRGSHGCSFPVPSGPWIFHFSKNELRDVT